MPDLLQLLDVKPRCGNGMCSRNLRDACKAAVITTALSSGYRPLIKTSGGFLRKASNN